LRGRGTRPASTCAPTLRDHAAEWTRAPPCGAQAGGTRRPAAKSGERARTPRARERRAGPRSMAHAPCRASRETRDACTPHVTDPAMEDRSGLAIPDGYEARGAAGRARAARAWGRHARNAPGGLPSGSMGQGIILIMRSRIAIVRLWNARGRNDVCEARRPPRRERRPSITVVFWLFPSE
jgi:hypothetical protein